MPDTLTSPARFGSNAGQPLTRRDGIAKVTGVANFAADNSPANLLHAFYVPASIARGRVTHLEVAPAEAHTGVTHVITPQKPPAPCKVNPPEKSPQGFSFSPLKEPAGKNPRGLFAGPT